MKLKEAVTYAWKNAIEIEFGKRKSWDGDTFTCKWMKTHCPNTWEKRGASGLYWFLVKDMSIEKLKNKNATDLSEKGISIPEIIKYNSNLFQDNLCKPDDDGFLIIYNGHEQNIFAGIRSHFAQKNNKTGVIGLEKYKSLSKYDIWVRLFHDKLPMENLEPDEQKFIKGLLGDKSGREALESYWRTYNGWPFSARDRI
ncbi:hypothetical protein [Brevibacillus migulae]|uniref:hypothetical protein n=1 Tax=Brevibacillus migulae TaxID=1644114 RepID=UPI00106EA5A6|nr:hypothetical protein [Brevibacillus migulae]